MRAVILADFAVPSGGAQKVAIESALALAEAGVEITFIHSIDGADPRLDHPAIRRVGLGFQDVWDRPALKGAAEGVWNGKAAHQLATLLPRLARGGQTVLHLHQWTRAFSPSILKVLLSSGMPLAITAHDYFLSCPNGVYYRFERDLPCGLTPLGPRCLLANCDPRSFAHKAVRVARSVVTRAALRGKPFDVVHVSDRGREILRRFLPKTLRHHRIDNPIPLAKGPVAVIKPQAVFAFIGRLTKEKGVVIAAKAAQLADAPMLFIGEGPAETEIMAANPGAVITGWRSRAEIEALLRGDVRAVVAPSLWLETGPLTVYEAAAMGVPAIASDRCGAAEKVKPGTTGFVLEPRPEALAEAMRFMMEGGVAQRLGMGAYGHYWEDPPTPAAHARRLIALYREMLKRERE